MKNKITIGDFREVSKKIESNSIDFVLHDFPYGVTKNEWDKNILELLTQGWEVISRVSKENTPTLAFSVQPYTTDLIVSNRENFRYDIIWDKVLTSSPLNANRMPLRTHEQINVFYSKPPLYNVIKTKNHERKTVKSTNSKINSNFGEFQRIGGYDSTERFPTSIWLASNGGMRSKAIHPTEKPLELIIRLLETYTKKGDLCLDLTSGSGVLGVACILTGRNFICIESDEEMAKKSQNRINETLGNVGLFSL